MTVANEVRKYNECRLRSWGLKSGFWEVMN